jgi:3-isopropylmalate dehydratase small subunit
MNTYYNSGYSQVVAQSYWGIFFENTIFATIFIQVDNISITPFYQYLKIKF